MATGRRLDMQNRSSILAGSTELAAQPSLRRTKSTDPYPTRQPDLRSQRLECRQPDSAPSPESLIDRVRAAIRLRHYSLRTEHTYVDWIRRFVRFHDRRHPRDMAAPEVTAFLTHLAVVGNVAASTQNQALAALLFLYRDVLGVELPWLNEIVRSKRPKRLPVVLTGTEVQRLLAQLDGTLDVRHRHALDGGVAPAGKRCGAGAF